MVRRTQIADCWISISSCYPIKIPFYPGLLLISHIPIQFYTLYLSYPYDIPINVVTNSRLPADSFPSKIILLASAQKPYSNSSHFLRASPITGVTGCHCWVKILVPSPGTHTPTPPKAQRTKRAASGLLVEIPRRNSSRTNRPTIPL